MDKGQRTVRPDYLGTELLEILRRNGDLTAAGLSEVSGYTTAEIGAALAEYVKTGKLRLSGGVYGIVSQSKPTADDDAPDVEGVF